MLINNVHHNIIGVICLILLDIKYYNQADFFYIKYKL